MSRAPVPRSFDVPPAPVVNEYGAYGDLPLRAPRHEPRLRPSRTQFAALLLALTVAAWVFAFAAWQATSRTVAVPALERTLAALTDIDALLALHEGAVRSEGQAARPQETIAVPGFPIASARLSAQEARSGTRDQWRATLLAQGADALYTRGIDAFAPEGAEPVDSSALSTSGGVQRVIEGVSASRHRLVQPFALGLGGAALLLAVLVLLSGDGARRFVAVGLALVVGAVFAALGGLALTLLVMAAGHSDGQASTEAYGIARTLAWLPVVNALRVAAAGLAIALPAAAVAIAQRRGPRDLEDPAWDGA